MSTTDAGVAAITLTEAELDRYVTHAPTRGLLSGAGLPADTGLLTFSPLRRHGLRTLADAADGPFRVADELRDRLVIGELLGPAGMERESILLDGGTGELTTAYLLDPSRPRPFAPSLDTLLRFAAVTEELAGLRGRFASLAGQYGPGAVAEATRRLLSLFEEGAGGEVPPYWKAAALIRPLALVAGPGTTSGLTLDVPARILDQEFGHGRVTRFEEVDFPATLTHEPTRRFLRETGLPEAAVLFHADTDVPLPTLREYVTEERAGDHLLHELPAHADHLIRLGRLVEDNSLVIDGRTGAVLTFSEPEATLHPLNTDVSTLAFTLWLLHHERTIDEHLGHELTTAAYDQLAAVMIHILSAVDPTGTAPGTDWHYWTELFQDEAGGVL
ncbi:SUKH-4 immunity protein of toxin-antitoxin system [Streptomyces puniciscabiei]|uniref:SUKH-4 immunity protein of toxin-antitoxin system n=1 Tax=Streptomyces puniciscabiei TaxID=164348 RepID=A0A542UHZ9_9ACTN|nr:SUKH-4 family immunity protein [Streptomyces puniciscabiei]TQK98710.1 SUKH-4 immunity protein of toxin-antitoxin system [Streptomyces puniciscabiei]